MLVYAADMDSKSFIPLVVAGSIANGRAQMPGTQLGHPLRVSARDNPPAGNATALKRAGGAGFHHGATRIARFCGSRPDTTTR